MQRNSEKTPKELIRVKKAQKTICSLLCYPYWAFKDCEEVTAFIHWMQFLSSFKVANSSMIRLRETLILKGNHESSILMALTFDYQEIPCLNLAKDILLFFLPLNLSASCQNNVVFERSLK